MTLEGRICFITGSTRGIGWATAREFARLGAVVILNGREPGAELESRCQELRTMAASQVEAIAADARDPTAVKACYRAIFQRFGRLDVLVNNAGILQDALLGMIPDSLIQQVLQTNLAGSVVHLQEAARLMSRKRSGSIINLSSIIGRVGHEGQTVYAASKAGIIGMTLSAAKELAPRNVRVNAVAPGFIATAMTEKLPPDKYRQNVATIRMGRVGQPEEVAQVIAFLASDLASYVTGQVLGVDGAMVV